MIKTTVALGMAALAFTLVACGAGDEETTSSSSDSLSASCISQIQAPPGSPAWRDALNQCLAGAGDVGGGGQNGGAPGGGWGGQSQSCSSGISCVNGSCTCTSGAAKGQACDGTTATGPSSCSVVCRSCN